MFTPALRQEPLRVRLPDLWDTGGGHPLPL